MRECRRLLLMARQYLARGAVPRRQAYCPVCGRKARLAAGTDRCSACLAEAIDRLFGHTGTTIRSWARDYDACIGCGTTERPHHAHGLCRRCWVRERRHVRIA